MNKDRVLVDFGAASSSDVTSHRAMADLPDVKVAIDFLRMSAPVLGWRSLIDLLLLLNPVYLLVGL